MAKAVPFPFARNLRPIFIPNEVRDLGFACVATVLLPHQYMSLRALHW
jgi:hypothetical protein